jgi:cytidine deaminase
VAIFKALSEGARRFAAMAIVANTAQPTPPCGACRQLIWEHCGDIPVILANLDGPIRRHAMRDLLPLPFDGGSLRDP